MGKKVTIRKHKSSFDFAIINRKVLQCSALSWSARGLYAYIQSLPDDWEISLADLCSRSVNDKRAATTRPFNELIDCGLIEKKRLHDERGRFVGWDYIVYPDFHGQNTECSFSEFGFSECGKSASTNNTLDKETINKGDSDRAPVFLDTKNEIQEQKEEEKGIDEARQAYDAIMRGNEGMWINKLQKPLTPAKALALVDQFGMKAVTEVIADMSNKTPQWARQKGYADAYRTILNWLKMRKIKVNNSNVSFRQVIRPSDI